MEHKSMIAGALLLLLDRDKEDAFVVLSEPTTEKFVQFSGSVSDPLVLDLPIPALTPVEQQRARVLLDEVGGRLEEAELLDRPGGEVIEHMPVFQLPLGRDVRRAALIALRVFAEVYRLPPDFELQVTEN